jgi:hypothetical protein
VVYLCDPFAGRRGLGPAEEEDAERKGDGRLGGPEIAQGVGARQLGTAEVVLVVTGAPRAHSAERERGLRGSQQPEQYL